MAQASFEYSFSGSRGLLWALVSTYTSRNTGVLSIQWDRFKKQIAFKAGTPVTIKSNWSQETLGAFLVKRQLIASKVLENELLAKEAAPEKIPLGEWLLKKGLLKSSDMPGLLEDHFKYRLFNLLDRNRGKVRFSEMEIAIDIPDYCHLTTPLPHLFWEAIHAHWSEAFCKEKLSENLQKTARVEGQLPFPLTAQELRHWNQLTVESPLASLKEEKLKLAAVAFEFNLLVFGESQTDKLLKRLNALELEFKSASWYQVLGVEEGASLDVSKKAFRERVKEFHPDRLPAQASAELRLCCERVFSKINEAFSVLSDPMKLEDYEASRVMATQGATIADVTKRLEAEMQLTQAKAALRRRQFQAAFDLLREIATLLRDDAEVLADKAFAEFMSLVDKKADVKTRLTGLKSELEASTKLDHPYAAAYYYRGMMNKFSGDLTQALKDFEQASSLDSHLTEAASEARLLRMRKSRS